ncbi:MAG: HAAS signaling domain-containing protein [Candidatus Thorarchaeota archaeon SMTZ1-45]
MSNDEVNRIIEEYLKKIAKLLPDGFETEDLLEDLRSHIDESYNNKVRNNPEGDKLDLIREVLDALGTPEEIAEEYGVVEAEEDEKENRSERWIYYTMRLTLVVLVVVVASWAASVITEGAVDFVFAVVVLLAFAVLEWLVRAQQTKDA